jgi:formate-dependent nitrite reductase membrane component NrfD
MAATPVPAGRTDTTPRRGISSGVSRLVTETKAAIKTTEFYAYVVTFVLVLIAGAQIKEKNNVDAFRADKVWLYITILTVGYMVARGLAKSGSREPYWEDSGQNRERDNDH